MYDESIFDGRLETLDEKDRILCKKVFAKVPAYFWKMPASTTSKYHPAYAREEGGLVKHTLQATYIFDLLAEHYKISKEDRDNGVIALIFHDAYKKGLHEQVWTLHEHPLLSAKVLDIFGREDIAKLIASHMGSWSASSRSRHILPLPETDLQKLVHLADYFASRKNIDFACELDYIDILTFCGDDNIDKVYKRRTEWKED